jgi:hypothetical protein
VEAPMSSSAESHPSPELLHLEVIRAFKQRFGKDPRFNVTPFGEDGIVRYHTDVSGYDVPAIHHQVRERIEEIIGGIHQGAASQVVILAGSPGMGKSHLINCFRPRAKQEQLGYVLVCNANQWKSSEFEACLLDWILDALVAPAPDEDNLLLERVKDIAFQALRQILARPGESDRFKSRSMSGFVRRWWGRLTGSEHSYFQRCIEQRDVEVFLRLDFQAFASHVCKRYLIKSSDLFHRYVLHVLLRYLFVEEREKVLHWLRRKPVHDHFLRKLGIQEEIGEQRFKLAEVSRILVSLFTPDVAAKLRAAGATAARDRVFFFAFDQSEAREALFEGEDEWRKFFAQVSELYNALPNVFILFTMTVALRKKYIDQMEGQFRDRIRHEDRFILGQIEPREVLSLYRQRLDRWLGDDPDDVRGKLAALGNPYLPFEQSQVLGFAGSGTVRDMIKTFDQRFREALAQAVIDVPLDYQVFQNELRRKEETTGPYPFTNDHLATVETLLQLAGLPISRSAGFDLHSYEWRETEGHGLAVLRVQFCDRTDQSRWFRVFLIRLPFNHRDKLEECVKVLSNLTRARNLLWLLRVNPIDPRVEEWKPGQVFARELPPRTETDLQAIVRTLEQRDRYSAEVWPSGEAYLIGKLRETYLGELLDTVGEALRRLPSTPEPSEVPEEAAEPGR